MLRAVQRLVSKSMVRSFKSVSTPALIVLPTRSNTLLIELKAIEIATTRILFMQDNILSPSSKKAINWVINIMRKGWVVEKQPNYHSSAYPSWSSPTIPPLIHLPSDATSHEQALREKPHVKAYIDGSAGNQVNIICCFQDGQSTFHEQTLPDYTTSFQAECIALNEALKLSSSVTEIYGNSRAALAAVFKNGKGSETTHQNREMLKLAGNATQLFWFPRSNKEIMAEIASIVGNADNTLKMIPTTTNSHVEYSKSYILGRIAGVLQSTWEKE